MNIQDALTLFFEFKRSVGLKETTISSYQQHLRLFSEAVQQQDVTKIKQADILRFLSQERERGMSPVTIKDRFRVLDVFFTWLEDNDELGNPRSPMHKIPTPRIPKKEPKRAKLEDVQRLLDSLPSESWLDLRNRALIELMLDTGLRVGEVTNLLISDIDIKKRVLLVRAGKGDKDRRVPFTEQTAKDLLAYWMTKPEGEPEFKNVVFVASNWSGTGSKGRLTSSGVAQLLQRLCKAAGVPHINPHSIRHAFACKAVDDGIRLEVVSKLMGHGDCGFTARVYAHLSTQAVQREYAERWSIGK